MMSWYEIDSWIVVTGVLCAAACALPGAILVLRRMSMMGDAISHAVLPGIAVAFLITQSRAPLSMFVGAAIIAVITALLVQWIRELGKTDGGTAMGIVFTTLFAIGIILMRQTADKVHLDADCVLYGVIEDAAGAMLTIAGVTLPRPVWVNGGMFLLNLFLIVLLYKEFKISAFDPALASTLGINARLMHYLLMIMTAATAVAAFESVGTILVIAMLIVPAATAYLLTERFGVMLLLSVAIGMVAAALGHVSAITVPTWFGFSDTVTAGMMACMSGVIFAVVWLVAPRHGMISKAMARLWLAQRIIREDVLGILYRAEELQQQRGAPMAQLTLYRTLGTGGWRGRLALWTLSRRDRITRAVDGYQLTDAGRQQAHGLIRSHRLWESVLHKHLHLPQDHVHAPAERLEHVTGPTLQEQLDQTAERPTRDPQGRRIPD